MDEMLIKDLVLRLKRLEGQVRGVQAMIESGKAPKSIITQIAAVRAALDKVGFSIIANELKREIAIKLTGGKSHMQQDLKEIVNLFMKLS